MRNHLPFGSLLHHTNLLALIVVTTAWMQCLQPSSSFLQRNIQQHYQYHPMKQSHLLSQSSTSSSQIEEQPIRPVFVSDNISFMAAATALSAYEVLTERTRIPSTRELKRVPPPAQPVYGIEQFDQYVRQQASSSRNEGSILHVSVDRIGHQLSEETVDQMTHVGFHLTPGRGENSMDPDTAKTCGMALQQVLQALPPGAKAFSSVDAPLHVAMLQANCLPKQSVSSSSALPHNDSYLVMMPNGDSVLMDYLYSDDLGGRDPLCCPTNELLVETSPTSPSLQRSIAQSAAYTALRGNDLDAVRSAAVAASVATILGDSNFGKEAIAWSTVERAVQLSKHIYQFGCKEMPGLMRKTYKEYGYK